MFSFTCTNLIALLEVITSSSEEFCFNQEQLLKHLKSLSSDAFEGRRTGTKGAEKAKKILIQNSI